MKKVIILRGLPASGKSTWAKKQVDSHPGVYKRVNKDDLRTMLDNGKWSKKNEEFVLSLRDHIILGALNSGYHVIVDDTNLHEKHESHIRELVKGHAEVEVKFFDISPEKAIERDLKRENSVGSKVIMSMYNSFLAAKWREYVPPKGKPAAFIFDIDGTLAHNNGKRSPYDWDKVGIDDADFDVINTLKALQKSGYKIIVFTGRDGSCEDQTKEWLARHGIEYDHFDMRPVGDKRKDVEVKREMFEKIKDDYAIVAVFDDRDQVVEGWRQLGLKCYQVNYGDF